VKSRAGESVLRTVDDKHFVKKGLQANAEGLF
jgi:hypothetical protein